MNIMIARSDLGTARNDGSVIVLTGTDETAGRRITFAGDARMMAALIDGIAAAGEATAVIESWQILGAGA